MTQTPNQDPSLNAIPDLKDRQFLARILATDPAELPALLDAMSEDDLRITSSLTGTSQRLNYPFREAVRAAVLRRPHRGAWPSAVL